MKLIQNFNMTFYVHRRLRERIMFNLNPPKIKNHMKKKKKKIYNIFCILKINVTIRISQKIKCTLQFIIFRCYNDSSVELHIREIILL